MNGIPARVCHSLYIGGEWRRPFIPTVEYAENPATGSPICEILVGSAREGMFAVQTAGLAFADWSKEPFEIRVKYLVEMRECFIAARGTLVHLLCLETGKCLRDAEEEVDLGLKVWDLCLAECLHLGAKSSALGSRKWNRTWPKGVTLVLATWADPVLTVIRTIVPALLAGCTVVVRPSRRAQLTSISLIHALDSASLPPGVLNFVTGSAGELVRPMMEEDDTAAVCFSGSEAVLGNLIRHSAKRSKLRVAAEIGANNFCYIDQSANVCNAAYSLLKTKVQNNGQSRWAVNRVYVHEKVYDDVCHTLETLLNNQVVGDPLHTETSIGPVIRAQAARELTRQVGEVCARGAEIIGPFGFTSKRGNFVPCCFLKNVPHDHDLRHQEIFGPVASIAPVSSHLEMIRCHDCSKIGLISYVFSLDENVLADVAANNKVSFVCPNHVDVTTLRILPFSSHTMQHQGYLSLYQHSTQFVTL